MIPLTLNPSFLSCYNYTHSTNLSFLLTGFSIETPENGLWGKGSMKKPNEIACICNILTFAPAQKFYSKVIHRKEVTVIERDRVGGLRLMIWDKVKVSLCHYSHAPEESNLWTAWQLFPLDDDLTSDSKIQ